MCALLAAQHPYLMRPCLVEWCFTMAQAGPGSVVSDGDALQYTATAFNGADLETGSIYSKDDDMAPEDERWRKRFRRRVKVRYPAGCKDCAACAVRRCLLSGSIPRIAMANSCVFEAISGILQQTCCV
jgi:hypothetical protein